MTDDRLTAEERAEARRLADAATPGPWRWAQLVDGIEARAIIDANGYHFARVDDIENGLFIAASRTLVPRLLADLEAAERERDEHGSAYVMASGLLATEQVRSSESLKERDTARAQVKTLAEALRTYASPAIADEILKAAGVGT